MKLVGTPSILEFDAFNVESAVSTAPTHGIGEMVNLGDGRIFRFGQAGAVALAQGKLMLPAVDVAGHQALVPTATAVGANVINVTAGATSISANEYNEGFAVISVTPGQGQVYKVSFNPAITNATAGNITIYDPINIALTTASRVSLSHNQWQLVVVSAASANSAKQRAAGWPMVAVPINNTCWLQTRGTTAGLADGIAPAGTTLVASGSVAGAVAVQSSTYSTAQTQMMVAQALMLANVDTSYQAFFAEID